IAIALLAALSVGGIAYALLAGRIREEDQIGRRLSQVQARSGANGRGKAAAAAAVNDPARRRKSVQDTLKEMEERQKAKSKQSSSPPLQLRLEQAGLSWSRNVFSMFSLMVGMGA